jgi:hypothetical protein
VTTKLAAPNAPLGYTLCFLNLFLDGYTNAAQVQGIRRGEAHRASGSGSRRGCVVNRPGQAGPGLGAFGSQVHEAGGDPTSPNALDPDLSPLPPAITLTPTHPPLPPSPKDEINRKHPKNDPVHMMCWMNFWCALYYGAYLAGESVVVEQVEWSGLERTG